MKYKLLKHIDNKDGEEISIGTSFVTEGKQLQLSSGGELNINWLIDNGYIEEFQENKLGDTNISIVNDQIRKNKEEIKRLSKEQKILKFSKKILMKK